ncbi:hypothetical protein J2N86_04325 [Legionella lytica]|uniref:Uncharacterized protein n=1 Tax=Legionella lytica TaxID=96232 RepID=A0ABY4YA69_9GAMM|nr:hypothetical protein [Legionella lytica]USQ14548.1 hypothetical protein J2N86_04325 [Legionella lytica]
MKDPFAALKDALQPVFHRAPMRNERFIYSEIQQLKQSLDNYHPIPQRKFIELLKFLRAVIPHLEKWHLDFGVIKAQIDCLTKTLNLPPMKWDNYLSHSSASLKFQFSALNHRPQEADLLTWLTHKSGTTIKHDSPNSIITMLLEYREHFGFSQKLSAQLKKEPQFLTNLIMESEDNFVQIVRTRLVLYLTDRQLAEAIIKHIPHFVQNNPDPITKAAQLVEKLNEILSNGRSISTILRNAEAKFILDSSELIQRYQTVELAKKSSKNTLPVSDNSPSLLEEGEFKLTF